MTDQPAPTSPPMLSRISDLVHRHRAATSILFLIILPLAMPYQALATNIIIYGLFALGFNLVFGYTGVLSFGHAAFFGVGAYGTGIMIVQFGAPWFLAIVIGIVVSGVTAMVIGALAIRTRGIYFAMVTLALAQCVYYIIYQMSDWTGGENGLTGVSVPTVNLGFVELNLLDPTTKYYFVLAFVAVAIFIFSRVLASPFGAVLEAIRENEDRARACGYDVQLTKWVAFVVSGLLCGLAGSLYAIHLSLVPIETLNYHMSGQVVMIALLGGMGTFFGPFVGAIVFLLLEDVVTSMTSHWPLVIGLVFMACVLFFPRGIWGSILGWGRRK
ncbi:branched-chain amino acid ABC transporter permease [Aquicoccus sp. G2-2]|jgi:branched-chain amino acid transport system permease protein|uniref:branched-chain amino acid ABC transporter permease n=1 Tax=Aquicoccus sp. G2-2 TaxID=3092120 RepID=UPI002AE04BAE|nr:branched-chain amino acid ABC transporter permease [Aquicoccus sp. G2-2]MEA1114597.1 branched-chain amino acid ABC transporter permease [Aquicoccus sp. G2-2]